MARPPWCALPQASMATMQRGCSAKKPRTFSRESFLRKPTPPSAKAPCAWKDRFARSRPIMLTLSMDALSVRGMRKHHHLGTSRCRQEGHPLHHLSPAAGSLRRIRLAKSWLAELARPLPHGLVADDDAASREDLLNHAQAEQEPKVQPNRVADDLGRKSVVGIAGANGRRHPVRLSALRPIRKPASSRVDGAASLFQVQRRAFHESPR